MRLGQNPGIRSFVRRTGMGSLAHRISTLFGDSSAHEAKFSNALINTIRPGDCVWDVGANVGVYTCQFAEKAGFSGRVIAFEPFEDAFHELSSNTCNLPQVQCVKSALGMVDQVLKVNIVGPASRANNLWRKDGSGGEESICVKTGCKLIKEGIAPPSVLKIDVEGFEEEVLWGFRESLQDKTCRAIFVEVHYRLLEQRGFLRAPSRVISLLQDMGFQTHWIDHSHVAGIRKGAA